MTHLIIESEGDMEFGLNYTFDLATAEGDNKSLEISFPSEEFMTLFMNNLLRDFMTNGVSARNGLDLTLRIPTDESEYGS